jgi:radical SAM protein with 4Fe4S-binding SPASM domain
VGQRHLAHGRISPPSAPPAARSSNFKIISVETTAASPHRWDTYDPFTHERCGECQYLPICMGGCPKAQFERNTFYLDAQSKYWEENIDTLLRTYHDTTAARLPVD